MHIALAMCAASPALAQFSYNESTQGDLSTDPNTPTVLAFGLGSNIVTGDVFNSNAVNFDFTSSAGDRDFWSFTVGAGQTLDRIELLAYDPANIGFGAIIEGGVGVIPGGATNSQLAAGILINADDITDADLLDEFANGAVTQNSLTAAELGPGTYTFIIQQTTSLAGLGGVPQAYSFNFVLVPSPGAAALLGVVGLAVRRRR